MLFSDLIKISLRKMKVLHDEAEIAVMTSG
jgi:hypothetical protein